MQRVTAIICLTLACQAASHGLDIGLAQAKHAPIIQPPIMSQAAPLQQHRPLLKAPATIFQLAEVRSQKLDALEAEETTLEAEGRVIARAEKKELEELKIVKEEEKQVKNMLKSDQMQSSALEAAQKELVKKQQDLETVIIEQDKLKKQIQGQIKANFKAEVKEQKRVEKVLAKEEKIKAEERVIENALEADASRLKVLDAEERQAEKLPQSESLKEIEARLKKEESELRKVVKDQQAVVRDLKKEIKDLEKEAKMGKPTAKAKLAEASPLSIFATAVCSFLVGSGITLAVFRFRRGDLPKGEMPLLAV